MTMISILSRSKVPCKQLSDDSDNNGHSPGGNK